MLIILPDYIANRIDTALDAEIAKHPDAAKDRDVLRQQLINHFAETGTVPEFTLQRNAEASHA